MVLADSDRASPTPPYSGYRYSNNSYAYGTVTLYGLIFQKILLQIIVHVRPYNLHNDCSLGFGLFRVRSPLLTESLNCFLLLRVLRCFSSPGCLSTHVEFHIFNMEGFPIRKSTDRSSFAAPRSLSQLTTSFIVSESQGIHHSPLFASDSLVECRIIGSQLNTFQTLIFSLITNLSKNFFDFGSANIQLRQ